MSLQDKVNQILAAVKSDQLQADDMPGPQSQIDRIDWLESRERHGAERIYLKVEMGIRALDTNHKSDHQEFLATAERLISAIKSELQEIISNQSTQ